MKKRFMVIIGIVLTLIICAGCASAENGKAERKSISVHFTLLGDEMHDSGKDNVVHTYHNGNLTEWLDIDIQIDEGSTVQDVFEKAADSNGIKYTDKGGGYISEVNGLVTGGNGDNAGWLFMLNGEYTNLGIDKQTVEDGDTIIFHYTDDFMEDMGA